MAWRPLVIRLTRPPLQGGDEPTKLANLDRRRSIDLLVCFGQAVHEVTAALEALCADRFAMEFALLTAPFAGPGVISKYQEIVLGEDRLDVYKRMAQRLTVEG